MKLNGNVSIGAAGAPVDIDAEVEASSFWMTNLAAGSIWETVSVDGVTWDRIGDSDWSDGRQTAVPDPFVSLNPADVTYLRQERGVHRLSAGPPDAVLDWLWSGMFDDADRATSSFEVLVGEHGVPSAAEIKVAGTRGAPPDPFEVNLHFAFARWGESMGITLPAEVIPTPTPRPFVPPAGSIPESSVAGTRLALVSWWGGPAWAIVVINPDGGGGKAWGEPSPERNYENAHPAFSPDGTLLAFSRVACELASPGEICPRLIAVVDAAGKQRDVTVGKNGSQDDNPSWSPDGSRIVFDSSRGVDEAAGGRNLFVIGIDGKGLTRVETGLTDAARPDWSPDGTAVVFQGANDTFDDRGLYTVGFDGSPAVAIVEGVGNSGPVWSPDGSRIGWSRFDWSGRERLVTMDPDGGNVVDLVEGYFGAWSPDGLVILFQPPAGSSDDAALWIVRSDGAGARRLPFQERMRSPGLDWAT